MWDFFTETNPKARKEYPCEAAYWVLNRLDFEDLTSEDLAIVNQAKSERWKILKGTEYVKLSGMYEGEFSEFRARKDLDEICKKYELYHE